MLSIKDLIKRTYSLNEIGHFLFYVGIFFLVSAPFISAIFLLIALIISFFLSRKNYFFDKWNYPFIVSGTLMLISSLFLIIQNNEFLDAYNPKLSLIGLLNWLPFFICFWAFQIYLENEESRKKCILFLLSGSVPVIITGLGQYFFNWHGPFEIFNGLIIWFQRPLNSDMGLTGLFSNQNYASSWLALAFPFSLYFLVSRKRKKADLIFSSIFLFLYVSTMVLTFSRNSLLAIAITLAFFLKINKKSIFIFVFSLTLITISIFNKENLFCLISINKDNLICNTFEKFSFYELREIFFRFDDFKSALRLEIWNEALNYIDEKKLFGWGAASFPHLLTLNKSLLISQHTHNLPLEIAIGYGIPASLLINITFYFLILKSLIKTNKFMLKQNKDNNLIDISWSVSCLIFVITHLFDVTYYDSRISILCWVLFAGLKNIIQDSKKSENQNT